MKISILKEERRGGNLVIHLELEVELAPNELVKTTPTEEEILERLWMYYGEFTYDLEKDFWPTQNIFESGIRYIGDLVQANASTLLKIEEVTPQELERIIEILQEKGLRLGMTPQDDPVLEIYNIKSNEEGFDPAREEWLYGKK